MRPPVQPSLPPIAAGVADLGDRPASPATAVAAVRLAVGFAQGLAIWGLTESGSWRDSHPVLFWASSLIDLAVPLVLLAGLGRMRAASLLAWSAVAAGLIAAYATYAVWRVTGDPLPVPSLDLTALGAAALYMMHHLVEPADETRRWPPPYPALVDGAWRHAFQLALSSAFAGVFWGVLALGGALFDLIGLHGVSGLLLKGWFAFPVLGTAFAGAVHLTDARPAMIAGVRAIGLALLSWLLTVATALLAAFLLALVVTGLGPLWATRHSTALLLAAAGLLVVLVNAAYGDGRQFDGLPLPIRWSARLAAGLLAPLVGLAAWALWLRVRQYGLTPDRVMAAAAATWAAVYAIGYLAATLRRGPWLGTLAPVNVAASLFAIAAIALLVSPALDPARLSVDDQLRRHADGSLPWSPADLAALRSDGDRFGRDALGTLAASPEPALARSARRAMEGREDEATTPPPGPPFAQARIRSEGRTLPDDFRGQDWSAKALPSSVGGCLLDASPCDVFIDDLKRDGTTIVVIRNGDGPPQAFGRDPSGRWTWLGSWSGTYCPGAAQALDEGRIHAVPGPLPDLEAGGSRLRFAPVDTCALSTP